MPTHDIRCQNCGDEFEHFQKGSRKIRKCKKCGGKLEYLISACHGYVAATQDSMKTVGDLANYNRDSMSKWEKEKADKEYADSSRMAKVQLERDKRGLGLLETDERTSRRLRGIQGNKAAIRKYVETGVIDD